VDYLGAALLVSGVSLLLLMLSWGGTEYAWRSSMILGLGGTSAILLVLFLLWESRASEPIIPLRLFRSRNFALANVGAFVLGVAMFGAILYIPLYLQVAKGYSPTSSGLLLLPLMGGVLVTSIVSGRIISHLGRYKWFMVVGAVFMVAGLLANLRLERATPIQEVSVFMLIVGVGLGLVMQPLILAAQNSLSFQDMGAGTSAVTFFRSLGGSFGVAVLGSVFNNRLTHWMAELMPAMPHGAAMTLDRSSLLGTPERILALPDPIRIAIQESFVRSLHTVFSVAAVIAVLAVVTTVLMPNGKLRGPESHGAPQPKADADAEADDAAIAEASAAAL
jgi:predicted MFS family arabinose efflux permease